MPASPHITAAEPARPVRMDGEQSRARLLHAALALFAQHGYAKTSIRDIADLAQANVAAISYYFGDKAGLYRAAFMEPMGKVEREVALFDGDQLTLDQALRGFFASFVEPLRLGDVSRQCMKLRLREMLEPTGLWAQEIDQGIKPMHDALVAVLRRHFGLAQADDELRRLAIGIAGLGVHLHVGRDITDMLAPNLNTDAQAWDVWTDRLVLYAEAMVAAELQRRAQALGGARRAGWLERVANSLCPASALKAGCDAAGRPAARRSLKDTITDVKRSLRPEAPRPPKTKTPGR
jgi:TetR/AcrR family transcriptional regulator, regulator of cefoperazone and chloramphenicol sensitivity